MSADNSGVYAITNTVTGDRYVGASMHVRKRVNQHLTLLRAGAHYNEPLQAAYEQYGRAAFQFSIIEHVEDTLTELWGREQHYIKALEPTYNIAGKSDLADQEDVALLEEPVTPRSPGRPRIYDEPRAPVTFQLPFPLLRAIDAAAAKARVTRTRYIEQVMERDPAVAASLERKEPTP